MTPSRGIVLDASVVVKLLVEEPGSDAADALVRDAARTGRWIGAPELLLTECANVLWVQMQRHNWSVEHGQRRLDVLQGLATGIDLKPLSPIVGAAWGYATSLGITVYDACYVALAEALDVPFVTADRALVRRCAPIPGRAFDLGDLRFS